ncbi:MAG: hypothetical protein V4477_24930 [Pseudomonadota bacterium]
MLTAPFVFVSRRCRNQRAVKPPSTGSATPVTKAIENELREAAERGYQQSSSEYIADLAGVAMPLPVQHRRLSLVVAGPTSRCLTRRPETAAIIQKLIQRFASELASS